jgi:hypothetical protein
MSFETLMTHDSIGWDVDFTLVGHPRAQAMAEFIRRTPEKRHVLVTFRTHQMARMIWVDLFRESRLTKDDFSGLLRIADAEFEACCMPSGLFIPTPNWLTWKGEVCHDQGLTVLVDDATDQVKRGCDLHDIVLIHPDDL